MFPALSQSGLTGNPLLCSMSPCWKNSSMILLLHFLCNSRPLAPCPISPRIMKFRRKIFLKKPAHFKAVERDSSLLLSSLKSTSPTARMLLNLFMMMKCFCRSKKGCFTRNQGFTCVQNHSDAALPKLAPLLLVQILGDVRVFLDF